MTEEAVMIEVGVKIEEPATVRTEAAEMTAEVVTIEEDVMTEVVGTTVAGEERADFAADPVLAVVGERQWKLK